MILKSNQRVMCLQLQRLVVDHKFLPINFEELWHYDIMTVARRISLNSTSGYGDSACELRCLDEMRNRRNNPSA